MSDLAREWEFHARRYHRALLLAWGALQECSPCRAADCQQVQHEFLALALKVIKQTLQDDPLGARARGRDE